MAYSWLGALLWSVPAFPAATTDTDQLDVYADPAGGVRATAHITFPAKPDIIQSILTDYAKWPELFETNMRVAGLSIDQGIATIDLRIAHALLPGEQRLVSQSQTIAGGGLVTALLTQCSEHRDPAFWWTQRVGVRTAALLRLVALDIRHAAQE